MEAKRDDRACGMIDRLTPRDRPARARGARIALARWLWSGQWRVHPGRLAAAVVAIGIGIALALAIHVVNRSALDEFGAAIAVVNGESQAQVVARAGAIDEALYPRVAAHPMVASASPVIETEIQARRADQRSGSGSGSGGSGESDKTGERSEEIRLRLIGLDVFRAAEVTPSLLARGGESGAASSVFADDAVFLSPAALQALGVAPGERLVVRGAQHAVTLRIAGTLGAAAPGQRLAVMDIGAAQWRLGWLGRLTRIDLRLAPGIDVAKARDALQPLLGPQATVAAPDAARQRMSNLSRAYRVNLNVLALVALFTGGFIVHATIALAVARQIPELALLAVLGAPRRFIMWAVLGQGAVLGALGAALGIAGGFGLAALMVAVVGGDLGGGYFQQSRPSLALDALEVAAFAALGVMVGLAGSAASARSARRMPPARALRSGGLLAAPPARGSIVRAAALGAIGALLLVLPPVRGLPLASYLAIAAWLFAAVAFVPVLTGQLGRAASSSAAIVGRRPVLWLSSCRVAGAPAGAAAALAGVVASVALASAMAIMVHSFRDSVDRWLDAVLPADLYLRARSPGADAALPVSLQARLSAIEGVSRIEFLRGSELSIEASRPAVALLARPIETGRAGDTLALVGALLEAPPGAIPIYVSEAMVDLYMMRAGRSVALPIPGASGERFFVAGVWRDYARQHGAIVIALDDYRRLTGDHSVGSAAIWLAPGTTAANVGESIRSALPELAEAEFTATDELRRISLRIFDRSFALTYVLEAIAIVVGLFGVTATYAGEALARAREFGMLRHLGVTRGQIARMLAAESALLIGTGVAWGIAVGAAIAMVLVHRVNPQAFHWTMEVAWPVPILTATAASLALCGVLAAVLASRSATGTAPVRAVREDW